MIEIQQIQTEEDYDRAIKMVDDLADAGFEHLTTEQEELLGHLADLIEAYEKEHYPI